MRDSMPIFFTSDPVGCVIQCGRPMDDGGRGGGGLYLAVISTGRRHAGVVRRKPQRAAHQQGQVFREVSGERRVRLMHYDEGRWRVRVLSDAGRIGSITERVLARDYVLEKAETAYG